MRHGWDGFRVRKGAYVLGEGRLKEIADRVLRAATADEVEVAITTQEECLTRFAENSIHQNVAETNVAVRVRAVVGKRVGVASINRFDDEAIDAVVRNAETVAQFQQENPEFQSLPEPAPVESIDGFREETVAFTAAERAAGVDSILRASRDSGLAASGAFSTAVGELAIANSRGVGVYHRDTTANVMTVIMGEDSSGYASQTAHSPADLDPAEVGRVAIDKALRSRRPEAIEPGAYTVILEEAAVADMLFYLGYLGMGALAVQEGRSFMGGRFGERVTGENVTIWDDARDARALGLPFDFEGVPKQPVLLIENGVARNVVYDTFTAGREPGKVSTGHSLPAPNTMGPIPIHLRLEPGTATKDEMVMSTERGIWVTRFHYTNPVHPLKTILTGMTRDGTFLIENGKVTRPLKNLRFTQSILEAFANAEALGSGLKLIKQGWGNVATLAPAAKIDGFRFTGATEF